ncbi:MAG: exopolysaccharide biosynthesis polyprenyl glycosylphosphotransferase [Bacteroidota bacterium]
MAYLAATVGFYAYDSSVTPLHEPFLSFFFLSSILWVLWMSIHGLYVTRYIFHYEIFLRKFPLASLGTACTLFLFKTLFTETDYAYIFLLTIACTQMVGIGLLRILGIVLYRYRRILRKGYKPLVIGDGPAAEELWHFFQQAGTPAARYSLATEESEGIDPIQIQRFALEHEVSEIYLVCSTQAEFLVEHLSDFCENHFIYLRLTAEDSVSANSAKLPTLANSTFSPPSNPTDVYGTIPVVTLKQYPLRPMLSQLTKRIFDVIFSFTVILFVLLPATVILAILIKAESRGPIFFRQRRGGMRNEAFTCLKFRSMRYIKGDIPFRQAQKNDPRVTRVGRFLRRTSLDELPQFLNVFWGQMSVVGPRPHPISLDQTYTPQIPKYSYRYFIKPGITGHAQINGLRGETRDPNEMSRRVEYDIWYIENWSLKTDLRIIWKTVVNICKGEEYAY